MIDHRAWRRGGCAGQGRSSDSGSSRGGRIFTATLQRMGIESSLSGIARHGPRVTRCGGDGVRRIMTRKWLRRFPRRTASVDFGRGCAVFYGRADDAQRGSRAPRLRGLPDGMIRDSSNPCEPGTLPSRRAWASARRTHNINADHMGGRMRGISERRSIDLFD